MLTRLMSNGFPLAHRTSCLFFPTFTLLHAACTCFLPSTPLTFSSSSFSHFIFLSFLICSGKHRWQLPQNKLMCLWPLYPQLATDAHTWSEVLSLPQFLT